MDELISKIKSVTGKLLSYDLKAYSDEARELVDMLMNEMPQIIAFYCDDRMQDFSQDAAYWPSQVERIIDALEVGDDFHTVDVLYNETRPNLIELKGILQERGLI